MSKIVKFKMSVGTNYVGSTVRDYAELEFDDDISEEEIEEEIEEYYKEWMWNNIDGGWYITETKEVKEENDD